MGVRTVIGLAAVIAAVPCAILVFMTVLELRFGHPLLWIHVQRIYWRRDGAPIWSAVTDAIGQVYRTDFNALGWVTAEHSPEPALAPIVHRYDRGGRATSTTNRRGQTMRATYDVLDRVLTRTDPVSGATTCP